MNLPYFSISPTKKVIIAPGNLQYNTYNSEWRFSPSQLTIIGHSNENESGENGWIDLFGWGTGKWPNLRSKRCKDYGLVFVDWGKLIQPGQKWFTLSNEDWRYILYYRFNAENLCCIGRIEDIKGLIILPDNIQLDNNILFQGRIDNYDDYEGTLLYYALRCANYTLNEWRYLNDKGAIFLPFGGYRYGNWIRDVNEIGWYWTSDNYCNSRNDDKGGSLLLRVSRYDELGDVGITDVDSYFTSYGFSIRLARNIIIENLH